MNEFNGEGNLGQDPELKTIKRGDEPQEVANLRVYFDRPVVDAAGHFEDKKGVWLDVEIWGARAKDVARLCAKGSRVAVKGSLIDDSYSKDGGEVFSVAVRASRVYLVPSAKLESVNYKANAAA